MAKKNDRVVVNKTYFELIVRKAELLDQMFDGDSVAVDLVTIKNKAQIDKAWDKAEAWHLDGSAEPYKEPKE